MRERASRRLLASTSPTARKSPSTIKHFCDGERRGDGRNCSIFFVNRKILFLLAILFISPLGIFAYKKGYYQDANKLGSSTDLQITVYPHELTVREGKEASFECRARTSDQTAYPSVRWTRVGGRLPDSGHEASGGRLTLHPTHLSDSGRYACVAMHDGRTVEAYALLHVQSYGPQEFKSSLQDGSSAGCMADEKACASQQCVKADYVCDGEPDCADRSDELNCPNKRHCEPNEFRCDNDRCIQKMWLCDGDDDCGDSSDERNCGQRKPGDLCQPTEFRCSDGQQCVPQSFQCDGTNDCRDGTDEVGCVQPTIVQPPDSNRMVPSGSEFKLTCRAVAVPDPYINWRLNWGPVCEPPRCQQQSEGGVGTLTVQNAQPVDQGAYTCEAINVKGRVLATPDCIVRIVNIPAPPPPPPSQPRSQLTCHPQGAVAPAPDVRDQCQCKPNVAGPTCGQCSSGSFNLNDQVPQGCMKCFCFGVSNQCQSSHHYRTKEKLFFNGDSQGVSLSSNVGVEQVPSNSGAFNFDHYGFLTHNEPHYEPQYWKLPQQYLGDKVTAYGGKLSFQLQYKGSGSIKSEPLVILKGNGITIVHRARNQESTFSSDRPFSVQVPTYEFSYEHLSGGAATREDLLMVLADLDTFLIRATHVDDQQSTSLGEVSWETAVERDTQDVRALEVEQCQCPPEYVGTSCEDCAPGYERSGHGPYLGTCVPRRAPPAPQCSTAGAVSSQPLYDGRCQCKQNAVGPTCDRCAPGAFHLAPQSQQGCLKCFCSGVTNQCQSSNLNRATTELDYSRGANDQLQLSTHDARAPFSPTTPAEIYDGAINFNALHEARGQSLYWKLPAQFLGDKITSYGGKLSYTHRSTAGGHSSEPDVILRGNDITLHHTSRAPAGSSRDNAVDVSISEEHWQRSDGQPATREHLLMALADLSEVLIKAGSNEGDSGASASLVRVSLEHALPAQEAPGGLRALEVEECECPVGYVGTSCEDCAPGYSRTGGGLYLGLCQKCDCNGHASECDAEYGACVNCQHNTEGDQCERCKPGFVGDAQRGTPHDCQRAPEEAQARPPCQCYNHSPRGCDSFGRCLLCEHNTEGYHCETCKKGFYGDATRATPYDCTPCPCPGASDCFLDQGGKVQCRNCPAGFAGRLCDECAPGYTRSQTSGGRDCEPIGRVHPDTIQFVPNPEVTLRVEILPPKDLNINEGNRAKWTCKVSEQFKPENVQLEWSKIGHTELPPNVRQHGNQLVIDTVSHADAGQYRCTGTTHEGGIATDEATLTIVPHRRIPPHPVAAQTQTPKPIVTPPHQTVDENQQAVFTCLTPGFADCEVEWHFNEVGGSLPPGVYKRGNQVFIPTVQQQHAGNYICTVFHQFGRAESNPGHLEVNRAQLRPMVDPPEHNVEVGDPARFRCWVPGVHDAVLTWRPAHGVSLPEGAEQQNGYLNFPRADLAHSGQYVCSAYDPQRDPHGSSPVDSESVRLNVRQDVEIAPTPQPPQVDPPHQTVDLGQPARFRCWVPGDPNARLRWTTYTNQPLPSGAAEDSQGVLTFPSVEEAHSGAYICSVFDPHSGKSIPSTPVRLIVQKPQKPLVNPPEQTVQSGEPSRIQCWVPGAGPHIRLRWQSRGGGDLPHGAHDDGRGVLSIPQTQAEHQREYECTAHDPQQPSSGPQTSDPARIHLQPAQPKQIHPSEESETSTPPRPVATPPLLTVKRGEPARFHCDANSPTPGAEVHWGAGPENGPLRGDATQHGDDLIINAAEDEHVGEYICTATNRYGTGRSEPVRLIITDNEEPPTARVVPKIWNGKPGERHQFKCHVTGVPTPQITWHGPPHGSSGGGRLPDDVVDLGDGVLEISNAKKHHEGDYTCQAINSVGEASDFGTVNVGPSLSVRTNPAGPKIVLTVGEPLKVECEAFGDPDPDVEWLHDPGPERGDLPDDYVPITISEQFIIHPKIGLGNAGRYTCKGSNQFASVTKDIYIEVVEPSHLATVAVLGGSKQYFPIGQPAQLVCASSGSSLVDRLEWTRDGSISNLPPEVSDQSEPGLLHFDTFKSSHEGEYECNAYRKEEKIASTKVSVNSDANLQPDAVHVEISPPTVRVVNKGDSIVLDCIVHGHSSEDFSYVWSLARGGSLIRQLSKESQLVVKDAEPSNDYGIYRCEVENADGDSMGEAQVAVAVGFDSASNPQEAKFDEDSEAVLTCPVFVVPGATVTWTKMDEELPANHQQKGNTLVIENFDDSASGIYTCSVQYGQSSIEGFVNAKIFVPDTTIKVILNASAESVQVGERAWLDCVVVGDANAKIEFSKEDAEILPENAQVTGNRLLFTSISEENSGKYKCRALTSEGPLETSALLNVEPAKRKRKDLVQSHFPPRLNTYEAAPMPHEQNPRIHVAALTKHHHHHSEHHKHGGKYRRNQKSSRHGHRHQLSHPQDERSEMVTQTSSFSSSMDGALAENKSAMMSKQQHLRQQQLRRRQRIAAARRQRHKMLQEKLAREAAARKKSKTESSSEAVQIVSLDMQDDKTLPQNHHNYKVWQQKYNHYDLKTTAVEEKPTKGTSIFGSWFTSS